MLAWLKTSFLNMKIVGGFIWVEELRWAAHRIVEYGDYQVGIDRTSISFPKTKSEQNDENLYTKRWVIRGSLSSIWRLQV